MEASLQAARQGNIQALVVAITPVVHSLVKKISGFGSKRFQHLIEHDDMVQDCLMTVVKDFEKCEAQDWENFTYWVYQVCRHVVCDITRKMTAARRDIRRTFVTSQCVGSSDLDATFNSSRGIFDTGFNVELAAKCDNEEWAEYIDSLDPQNRQILTMMAAGHHAADISKETGLTVNQIYKALARLKHAAKTAC